MLPVNDQNMTYKDAHLPRVAMIASGDVFGGAERQIMTLCKSATGLFHGTVFQTLPGPLVHEAEKNGIKVRTDLIGKGIIGQGRALSQIVFAEQFDIIHVHGYRGSVLAFLALVFGAHRPVVRTVHGAPEHPMSFKMELYSAIGELSAKLCSAHSVYVSEELKRTIGKSKENSSVIHNGREPALAQPRPVEYQDKALNLVAVGRLEPVKGLTRAIQAMGDESMPAGAHLHLIGDGPQRSSLEALAETLGVAEKVHFHGFRPEALAFIASADALLLPSVHEGIPYVLLEAMSFGVPAIASRVGGIPEVATHLNDAYLLDEASPESIARAVRVLSRNAELRNTLSENGKSKIAKDFSAQGMAEQYACLYESLMRKRPSNG
jgi:glycosyltransferase involved in cell wall biosynthesis